MNAAAAAAAAAAATDKAANAPDNVLLVDVRYSLRWGGGGEQEGGYTCKETKTMVKSWV
jgi:hypothetical protein